jgi:hypothetical protein
MAAIWETLSTYSKMEFDISLVSLVHLLDQAHDTFTKKILYI